MSPFLLSPNLSRCRGEGTEASPPPERKKADVGVPLPHPVLLPHPGTLP